MPRYFIRKGPIECFHVEAGDGVPISTISILDHNLPPLTLAFHLTQAAAWFAEIAKHEVEPTVIRRVKPLKEA